MLKVGRHAQVIGAWRPGPTRSTSRRSTRRTERASSRWRLLQPLLIGLLLLWSSYGKSPTRSRQIVRRCRAWSANHARTRRIGPLVGVEILIALALLLPPASRIEAVAAVALAVGFTGYLIYAKIVVPEASCGCTGASAKPVGRRAIGRALFYQQQLRWRPRPMPDGGRPVRPRRCSSGGCRVRHAVRRAGSVLAVAVAPAAAPVRHPLAGTATDAVPLAATQRRLCSARRTRGRRAAAVRYPRLLGRRGLAVRQLHRQVRRPPGDRRVRR